MTGAATDGGKQRLEIVAAKAPRRQPAARAGRSCLRLVARPDADAAPAGGQNEERARLLGAYNLYNG